MRRPSRRPWRLLPAVAALLAGTASAQEVLLDLVGEAVDDQLGFVARPAGDVDADGVADFVTLARNHDAGGDNSGRAYVVSGATGAALHTVDGTGARQIRSANGVGDVDSDGHADFALGVRDDTNGANAGAVDVISGRDGTLIRTHLGDSGGDDAYYVAPAGDLDADGVPDYAVGAPLDDDNGARCGSVRAFSGATGATLYTFYGPSSLDRAGLNLYDARMGDLDGDGHDDLIVSVPWGRQGQLGFVEVRSGRTGAALLTIDGTVNRARLGTRVTGLGDVDGDGTPDLAASEIDSNSSNSRATVFSGADGSVLFRVESTGPNQEVVAVGRAGDLDLDGRADFLVSGAIPAALGFGTRWTGAYSGADGSLQFALTRFGNSDSFGQHANALGDVNGDGVPDLLVSARHSSAGGFFSGATTVFSGVPGPDCNGNAVDDAIDLAFGTARDLDGNGVPDSCEVLGTRYCSPNSTNSTGASAQIEAWGDAAAADDRVFVRTTGLPRFQFGYYLTSRDRGMVAAAGGSQGTLCLGGSIGRYVGQVQNSGADGVVMLRLDLTSMPVNPSVGAQSGETWNFQFWHRDVQPLPTSNFSDAIEIVFE